MSASGARSTACGRALERPIFAGIGLKLGIARSMHRLGGRHEPFGIGSALLERDSQSLQNTLHVPAYAALTLAWRRALRAWLRTVSAGALAACAIASICGVLHEWNQSFVPGRYASLTDIVLNGAGVALGIWFAAWIRKAYRVMRPAD